MPVHVTHLQRRPHPGQRSIEQVFQTVRSGLLEHPEVSVDVLVSPYVNAGVLPRLRAVLWARRHQAEVTHLVGDVHYLVLLMRKRTTVLTVHDVEFLARHTGLKGWIYTWLWLRLPVRRSGVVTVGTASTRADLVALTGLDPAAVQVIPHPVRELFVPAPLPARRDRPVVLLIGTWPTKNLVRSTAALRGLDIRVVLIGALREDQSTLLDGLDATHLTDLSDEQVLAAMHDCDLLLFPSLQEGFGLPIVEAQAAGRPVVTSDRSPMRDVAGGAACLVDPEDVEAIRAGVQRVLTDRVYAGALVEAGLVNAASYTLAAVAGAYAAVYAGLAGPVRPGR